MVFALDGDSTMTSVFFAAADLLPVFFALVFFAAVDFAADLVSAFAFASVFFAVCAAIFPPQNDIFLLVIFLFYRQVIQYDAVFDCHGYPFTVYNNTYNSTKLNILQ